MDLEKIGKYIATKRKALGITQVQLAERLGMSDKSVSKWERGICLPDVSVYMELCEILGITLNEFIAGEDLDQENVVKQSEKNLIQVAKDGDEKKKKMKIIIVFLLCLVLLVTGILFAALFLNGEFSTNYIEPLPRDSAEMEIAQILSDVDGAYLYDYSLDGSFTEMTFFMSLYKDGVLEQEEELGGIYFETGTAREGMIALIPDFQDFKIKLIAAGGGAKYSMEFDILEGVSEREYYGRSASGIAEKIHISPDAGIDLTAFLYGRDGLSVIPVEDIREQADHLQNDYIYMISVKFGGRIEE